MTEGNDLISLTIDGLEIAVEPGTHVIDAAERAGALIPRYCYHPGIPTRPAQCRVCLVEIEGQPKLQPSCKMTVQEGMVVHTVSEEAEDARRAVIELLLVNHPLDCPICDAAGQCMLQDYALETEQLRSRLHEEKLVQGRDRIADDILYFADRCIICTRCVRFMSEVAGDEALVVAQRGDRNVIDTFPGRDLDHPFQGNIVDVCPVGALVHEDFLFKARFWDLDQAASICPGCSTGCNVTIDVKENQIVRLKPRHNPEVNSYWMCDHGRKHLVMSNRGERADVPLIRRDGRLVAADWSEALAWVADRLLEVTGGDVVVSADAANESLFFLRRLLDRLGIGGGSFRVPTGEEATLAGFPKLALRAERAPNATGAELFGFTRTDEPARLLPLRRGTGVERRPKRARRPPGHRVRGDGGQLHELRGQGAALPSGPSAAGAGAARLDDPEPTDRGVGPTARRRDRHRDAAGGQPGVRRHGRRHAGARRSRLGLDRTEGRLPRTGRRCGLG
jgi:NADH-quinone oxidoreductase subunit G